MTATGFACRCKALRGVVADVSPAASTHIICHCRDCRAAYVHLGGDDPGRVDILQTGQDQVRILEGAVHLRAFRHTSRGLIRWYAGCCGTPLFATPSHARLVHVGVNADRLDDLSAVGKVVAEAFVSAAGGRTRSRGLARMVTRWLSRMAAKNLSGEWRNSPFFDIAGSPVTDPEVLTREARSAALACVTS